MFRFINKKMISIGFQTLTDNNWGLRVQLKVRAILFLQILKKNLVPKIQLIIYCTKCNTCVDGN